MIHRVVQNQSEYCWCCRPFHVCVICFGVGPGLSSSTPGRPLLAQGTRYWLLITCSGGLNPAPLLSPVYTWQRGRDLSDEALSFVLDCLKCVWFCNGCRNAISVLIFCVAPSIVHIYVSMHLIQFKLFGTFVMQIINFGHQTFI